MTSPITPDAGVEPGTALTCFGVALDTLAREVGAWPGNAVVHSMEVLGRGIRDQGPRPDNPQVLLEGHIPTGEKDGRATFKGADRAMSFKAVVRLSEYRACFAERVK